MILRAIPLDEMPEREVIREGMRSLTGRDKLYSEMDDGELRAAYSEAYSTIKNLLDEQAAIEDLPSDATYPVETPPTKRADLISALIKLDIRLMAKRMLSGVSSGEGVLISTGGIA